MAELSLTDEVKFSDIRGKLRVEQAELYWAPGEDQSGISLRHCLTTVTVPCFLTFIYEDRASSLKGQNKLQCLKMLGVAIVAALCYSMDHKRVFLFK